MGRIEHFTSPRGIRWIVLGTLIAVFGALVAPPAFAQDSEETWLAPAAEGVPHHAELVTAVPIADALILRGTAPEGAPTLDTELSWHATDQERAPLYPDTFIDPAVEAVRGGEGLASGAGAVVALIDTGVANVEGLATSVAAEVDFTGEGGGDGFGHGTYMASLIAADAAPAPGVAPDAGIISLKVADDEGTATLGQVLGAMEWLYGPGRSLGIRVASLSLGVDRDSPAGHLLDMAVDHLAATGVLVLTATGNDGPGQLTSPASAPGSISVGALDGDEPAEFSATGTDRAGASTPDLLAPGVGVVGHLATGSMIAGAVEQDLDTNADRAARLERGLLEGSGTSAATALMTGVAAIVSDAYPEFDGGDLAEALLASGERPTVRSALDAAASIEPTRPVTEPASRPGKAPEHASAPASLSSDARHRPPEHLEELALPAVADWQPAEWNDDVGGWSTTESWAVDRWNAAPWHDASWSVARWNVARWNVARWNVARWNADDWSAGTWDAADWDVARWNGGDWDVARWNVARWNVARWNADDWNVARWNADDWNVARWNVARWNADDWNVARWNVARWNTDDWNVARWNTAHWGLTSMP